MPLRSVAEILSLPVDELTKRRPAVVEGVVTFSADRKMFLVVEDATGPLFVSSLATATHLGLGPLPPIEPGLVVEIEGEVIPGGYAPTLFPRRARVTGRRPVPPAKPADLGRLVRCRGVVQALQPKGDRLVVELSSDALPWSAEFGPPMATAAARLAVGSEVDITGILVSELHDHGGLGPRVVDPAAERVTLLAGDADDITIVRPVSWWTRGRLLGLIAGLSCVLALAVGLAAILAWAVRRQAAVLATTMRSQRDATIEFESALRERNRLAANLHDTVLQTVTGLGFQLQACQVEAERQGTIPADRLELPRRMVSHAVGGRCTVESRPGGGTTVAAAVPTGDREPDLSDRAIISEKTYPEGPRGRLQSPPPRHPQKIRSTCPIGPCRKTAADG